MDGNQPQFNHPVAQLQQQPVRWTGINRVVLTQQTSGECHRKKNQYTKAKNYIYKSYN